MPDSRPADLDRFRPDTAPLRRIDREWQELWSERLDARIHPSVSGAAQVSTIIRVAAATGKGGLRDSVKLIRSEAGVG